MTTSFIRRVWPSFLRTPDLGVYFEVFLWGHLRLLRLDAPDKEICQSAHVRSIVKVSEARLLASGSDPVGFTWVTQYGHHPVRKIPLIARLSDVGVHFVCEKICESPTPEVMTGRPAARYPPSLFGSLVNDLSSFQSGISSAPAVL